MPRLNEEDLATALQTLPGWTVEGDHLQKTYTFERYADGVLFALACARLAELKDHHPDLCLTYKKVQVILSTHSEGGITEKDVEMARMIEGCLARP